MLTLNDGRTELWQWDTGRTLAVDADCSQVHFSNKVFGRSIDVDVVDGAAIIPDILLQTDKDLNVWAFVGTAENGYTKISKTFKVNRRNKPADYVFTPHEQTTLAELSGRLDKIEESQDPDAIKNAVDDYLAQNPVEAPVQSVNGQIGAVELTADDVGAISDETDPTVPDWAKQHTKPSYTAEEVGALPASTVIPTVPDNVSAFRNDAGYLTEHQDISGKLDASELPTAINTALAQAKASGEFDGADGKDGADGVGIQSVEQTVTSTEDVGTNVITVTKTDGTSSTFAVKNGSKGDPGAPGNDGHSPVVTATKSGKTTTISVDGADIATVEDGAPGAKGADGKSAYQYAVDGGYTGTEAEFTDKLAQEQLAGTTNELTPTQVYQAVSAGIPVKVQYFDETFGLFSYTNFNVGENINVIGANTIVYFYDTYTFGGLFGNISDNTWYFYTTALAKKSDIPSALPNPNALTFTGAVTGSYDGSTAKTVNIPSAVTDDHINSLIDTKLGVIENGAY